MLGLVSRVTGDIDVLALATNDILEPANPLPVALSTARDRVARDVSLPEDWLNAGSAELVRFGLPEGFLSRVETRTYGPALLVHLASRYDQIHFKLYAVVDQGAGRHEADLWALDPSREELIEAARWARTHDPSPGFRQSLLGALRQFGVEDADADIGP